jgi:molybdenum cofactor cytidylyltransferase
MPKQSSRFVAIILAAGSSQRMGGPNKLLLPWKGEPLAVHAMQAACASAAEQVILVTGRDGDEIAALYAHPKIVRAHNDHFKDGLAGSLHIGLQAAGAAEAAAIVLADMPGISVNLIDELWRAWSENCYALVPTFEGRWGNPVLLGRQAAKDALTVTGDKGARTLLENARSRVIEYAVQSPEIERDVDHPLDFPV